MATWQKRAWIVPIFALAGALCINPLAARADVPTLLSAGDGGSHDSGGNHHHSIYASAEIASPVVSGVYSSSYLSGTLPATSGSGHWVEFSSARSFDSIAVSWDAGIVGDGTFSGTSSSSDTLGSITINADSSGLWVRYFNVFGSFDIGSIGQTTNMQAMAYAQLEDEAYMLDTGVAQHYHFFTVIP